MSNFQSLSKMSEMLESGDVECTNLEQESSEDPSHCIYLAESTPTSSKEEFKNINIKCKKIKKYQIENTYSDEEEEMKRLNAKKAYYNRVKKKITELEREEELKSITNERDHLLFEKTLWEKEKEFWLEKEKQWGKEKLGWEKERASYTKQLESYLVILKNLSQSKN